MDRYKGPEKRRFVRIPFWFVNKYRVYPYTVPEYREGVGRNISIGGICFEGDMSFPLGAKLEVELDMPSLDHAVRAIGQLVWIHPQADKQKFIYGLHFTNINDKDLSAIEKVVETFS